MVKFEDIYRAWLETQEKKYEIIELVEKFFNGFRDLYGIEFDSCDNINYKCLNIGTLVTSKSGFGVFDYSDGYFWLFYVEGSMVTFTKAGYERFSFVPRSDKWDTCTIISLPCSLCRYVICEPTPEQIKSKTCHRHTLLT